MPDGAPIPSSPARHEDDWDRHWEEFAAESSANPAVAYRARLLVRMLGPSPQRLLDIGVGVGDFLALASETWPDADLAGVDISASGVALVGERVPAATLRVADLTSADAAPDGLSAWASHAVCSEVLEHVDDPVALLANSRAMMAPRCRLVVTVPSGKMTAFDHHIGHRRHYTPELLAAQLSAGGFLVDEVLRAGFPFFNLYRLAVRIQGERLIDQAGGEGGEPSAAVRAAMAVFDRLFRLNLTRSRWGLQLVALARPAS